VASVANTVYDVADHLRQRGWLVPAYSFPPNLENLDVIRIVIRNGFSQDMARFLLDDLKATSEHFDLLDRPMPRLKQTSTFHH
jgi:glutamate decarboxylase